MARLPRAFCDRDAGGFRPASLNRVFCEGVHPQRPAERPTVTRWVAWAVLPLLAALSAYGAWYCARDGFIRRQLRRRDGGVATGAEAVVLGALGVIVYGGVSVGIVIVLWLGQ